MGRKSGNTPAETSTQAASVSLVLPSSLTISTIDNFASEVKQLPLQQPMSLSIDGSRVESITTPAMQLIVALEKAVSAAGGTMVFTGKTHMLAQAFHDAGLDAVLQQR